jgi:hypothetical protein
MIFLSEAKAFLEEKRKSMLPDLIKCKSDVSSGRILNEDLAPRYLYDIL